MNRFVTRRRLGAGLAALTGIAMGFPSRALACEKVKFGNFEVYAGFEDDPAIFIHERSRSSNVHLFLKLKPNGEVAFVSTVEGKMDDLQGSNFDLIFRFDDGTTTVERFVKHTSWPTEGDQGGLMIFAKPDLRSRLFKKFRSAYTMDIEVIDRDAGKSIGTERGMSLQGSSKATKHAQYLLRTCVNTSVDLMEEVYGCFLTTACVDDLGLTDDCFELRTLRRFRDCVMARTERGRARAALYRELAPAILAALPIGQRRQILRAVYGRYIVPSAIAARLGLNGLAHRIYVKLMLTMLRRFRPDLLLDRQEELTELFGQQAKQNVTGD